MEIEVSNRKRLIDSRISLPIIIFIISIFINYVNINFTANRIFIYINNPIVDIIIYILWIVNYILYFILYCDNSDIMKMVKDSDLWKRINLDVIFVTLLILLDFTKSLYALHKK